MTMPLKAAAVAFLAAVPAPALADTLEDRRKRGDAVVRSLNNGVPQPALENMRREFPFLADATEAYALGDVWSREVLDAKTRQLAAVAAFAATGQTGIMRTHAGYALNIGVTEEELKEIVYLITVPAGFSRAIEASQVLSQLFADRREAEEGSAAR